MLTEKEMMRIRIELANTTVELKKSLASIPLSCGGMVWMRIDKIKTLENRLVDEIVKIMTAK